MGRVTVRERVVRIRNNTPGTRADTLIVEEPLEIRLNGEPLTVTMRTPGNDFDLAAGFLLSEGVVGGPSDLATIRYCAGALEDGTNTYNVLDVTQGTDTVLPQNSLARNFYTTSSCGVCGKASLDAVRTVSRWSLDEDRFQVTPALLSALPDRLRAAQRLFQRTGALHAAGLFSADGELLALREDVGRHNAVDKILGWAVREGAVPLRGTILMVSGRASFELAQKAVMGGIPMLAAVSAPSSLAVELAAESGLTLVGFLRGESMNVYAGVERVDLTGEVVETDADTEPAPGGASVSGTEPAPSLAAARPGDTGSADR